MTLCTEETVYIRGRKVKFYRGGAGRQLLFLHHAFCPVWLPIHETLAAQFEVVVPIHPGFAGSEESLDEFEEMEGLLFHYLDLRLALDLDRPVVVGASFGGWITAEWAMRYGATLSQLILIDALGLRVDGAPAADVFSLDGAAHVRALRLSISRQSAIELLSLSNQNSNADYLGRARRFGCAGPWPCLSRRNHRF